MAAASAAGKRADARSGRPRRHDSRTGSPSEGLQCALVSSTAASFIDSWPLRPSSSQHGMSAWHVHYPRDAHSNQTVVACP